MANKMNMINGHGTSLQNFILCFVCLCFGKKALEGHFQKLLRKVSFMVRKCQKALTISFLDLFL